MRTVWNICAALVVALPAFCGADAYSAEKLKPSALFTDHAVLQREKPVPVWGETRVGEEVSVRFAGQTKTVKADANGNWKVVLDPLKGSKEPAELTIQSGAETVTVKNVVVGEVWVASGQSNMEFLLGWLRMRDGKETPIVKFIQEADYPLLRQFTVPKTKSPDKPLTTVSGKWTVCSSKTANDFSATGFFFARSLMLKLDVPVALLYNPWGGMPVESFMSRAALESVESGKKYIAEQEKAQAEYTPEKYAEIDKKNLEKWEAEKKAAEAAGKPAPRKPNPMEQPRNTPTYPATLFNGMVHPLIPFAIRGAIWYQGESNWKFPRTYYETFPAMITQWRKDWGQGDFPFYFVQLANYMDVNEKPEPNCQWAFLRDAQRLALKLPNTGMAVIMDVGEEKDIHPRNKVTVGERLALWALANDYKLSDVKVFSGPLFKSVTFQDGKAIVTFDSVGSGLIAGKRADVWTEPVLNSDEPARFMVCGADKNWVWAKAKITGANTVEVSAEGVAQPVAVRYAWMKNPGSVNMLYNKEGLPASPFRSDDF